MPHGLLALNNAADLNTAQQSLICDEISHADEAQTQWLSNRQQVALQLLVQGEMERGWEEQKGDGDRGDGGKEAKGPTLSSLTFWPESLLLTTSLLQKCINPHRK